MKKTIFLHTGTHKTGSTAIQTFLHSNYEKFLVNGILYPKTGRPDFARHGQHIIPWLFTDNENYIPTVKGERYTSSLNKKAFIQELFNEIENSNCSRIILSSEEFDILKDNELENLFSYFTNYKIIPITFIRNTVDFLQSSYQTSVTYSGYSNNFESFCNNQRSRLDISNFLRKLDSLSNGTSVIFNYDDRDIKSNVVKAMLSILDIDFEVEIPKEKSNTSLPLETIEVIRFFNNKEIPFEITSKLIENLKTIKTTRNSLIFNREDFKKYNDYYINEIKNLNASICNGKEIEFEYNDNDITFIDNNLVNSLLKLFSAKLSNNS